MREFLRTLNSLKGLDEDTLLTLMREGETPDSVLAALLSVFDGYENTTKDYDNIPEYHWLYQYAQEAIDRVFSLVAQSSGEDDRAIKMMLYRAVCQYVEKNKDEIYKGFEEQYPFGDEKKWDWPVVNAAPGTGTSDVIFQEFSALKMFGYTVGKTNGWDTAKRQSFLSDFLEMELPLAVTEHFGEEYGKPISTNRLRKVANLLASFCRLRLRDNPARYKHAIADWEDDLAFLKAKYYDGLGLKFVPWPDPRD